MQAPTNLNVSEYFAELYDEGAVTEVIRPSAIVPEESARATLAQLAARDVSIGGVWQSDPAKWNRYDSPFIAPGVPGLAQLVGTIQVAYGTPTRYEITIYRVTITTRGFQLGWTVEALCNEALGFGGLSLDSCPRAQLTAPPKPFRF